ncbi:response regulator [Clostridiaceae bacterium HSG29]|nr:response regulator [Clostridiaceae bacterium HSG29]
MIVNNVDVVEILLVEDNPGDQRLTVEALREGKIKNNLNIVSDGESAIKYLKKEGKFSEVVKPDLILLDLNLPKKDGREVLSIIKSDINLKRIPVVILTTSNADKDVIDSYNLNVNCYITKPVDFDQFTNIVKQIGQFWFEIVRLPNE